MVEHYYSKVGFFKGGVAIKGNERKEGKGFLFFLLRLEHWDFPGGAVVRNPPANAGDTSLSPGLGRPHTPRSN